MNPTPISIARAYLAGVLHGDGWCGKDAGLRAKDEDFVRAWAEAARIGLRLTIRVRFDGYWVARTRRVDLVAPLRDFRPTSQEEHAAWVRGFFDSDGNANLRLNGMSEHSYGRGVEMFKSNLHSLGLAADSLAALGIPTILRPMTNSSSHLGTKQMYRLTVRGSQENYAKFGSLVGSSIARKHRVLTAIPDSYRPDAAEHYRSAQRKGAATRRNRAEQERLPQLLSMIRSLIDDGKNPTTRVCCGLPGYSSARTTIGLRHSQIIEMARRDSA